MNVHRERRPGELVFTLLLLLGSLYMLWEAYGISKFESITSAGVFPMVTTAVMVVTAGLALVATLRSPLRHDGEGRSLPQRFLREITPGVLLGFTAAIALYMGLLERLGFLLSSYLFLVAGMALLGSRRWVLNLLVSAACLAGIYLVFRMAFSVVLPGGTWLQAVLR